MGTWFETIEAADLSEVALRQLIAERMATRGALHVTGARLAGEPLAFWRCAAEVLGDDARFMEAGDDGESLFLTAADVAYHAAQLDPGLGARLFVLPIRFGEAGAATPILHDQGGRLKLNWLCGQAPTDRGEEVAALCEDFRLFLDRLVETGVAQRLQLKAGDAIFFRDNEMLHGRAAQASDERLWNAVPLDRAA